MQAQISISVSVNFYGDIMKYVFDTENNSIIISEIEDFDLEQTFECGQCFRWDRDKDGVYTGIVNGKKLSIYNDNNTIIIKNTTQAEFESIWSDYFDLELNYSDIRNNLQEIHPIMKEACKFAPGIRILKQNSFEALISFIISQNNNIPRIKGIINRLCESFGEKCESGYYKFPTPEKLAGLTESDLSVIRSGFRAKYIIDAAKKVYSKEIDLEKIKTMPIDEAKEELMKIKGVGPKVADCTMLYGMHRLECFPLDVWMKRAMGVYFPDMTPADFGEYAGIAQQYIFHFSRINGVEI